MAIHASVKGIYEGKETGTGSGTKRLMGGSDKMVGELADPVNPFGTG